MPVDYIVNSTKPYPDWIKTHRVFKDLSKIDKIFPKLGLRNFSAEINVLSLAESRASAAILQSKLCYNISLIYNEALAKVAPLYTQASSRERNSLCNKLQFMAMIYQQVYTALTGPAIISVIENKVTLSANRDVYSGNSDNPLFKKGEGAIKIYQKINQLAQDCGIRTYPHEDLIEFKNFSKLNIPASKYKMVFSSEGEEGAWDIATMSMRGITSCQSWASPQSRGLIGTISSKYTAIVYIESKTDKFPPYGSGMQNRCVVRLGFLRGTNTATVIIDHMYPAFNQEMMTEIKKEITNRSGLPAVSSNELTREVISRDYTVLEEDYRSQLVQGESSYMDSPLVFLPKTSAIKSVKNPPNHTTTIANLNNIYISKLTARMLEKRAYYNESLKKINEYNDEKSKWEEQIDAVPFKTILGTVIAKRGGFQKEKPKIEPMFEDLKKGQYAYKTILNFFAHCDKSGVNAAPRLFARPILDKMAKLPLIDHSNIEYSYSKLLLIELNKPSFKNQVWEQLSKGTWSVAFPKSSKRFFNTVIEELKILARESWKESLKKI